MTENEQENKTKEILTNEEGLKVNENFEEGGFTKNRDNIGSQYLFKRIVILIF